MAFVLVSNCLGGVNSIGSYIWDTEGDRLGAPLVISDKAEEGFKVETTNDWPLGIFEEAEDSFKLEATCGCDWEVVSEEKDANSRNGQ